MQLFQGMSIDGQPEKLRRLPDEIEKRLTGGWSRNRPRESKMNKSSLSSELYCFHCEEAPDREAVDVWLSRDSNQLRVSNIVPSDVSELSYAQYNAILKEFAEQFALAAAQSLGLRVEITRPDVTVEDVLPPDLVRALVDFSTHANKGSRASHPRDKARWQKFLIGAHQAHSELGSDILSDWLVQQGWPSDAASELASEYDRGRALLEQYEMQPQHA
jgi:hypothetical protein